MYSFLFSNALIIRYSMQFGCPCFCRCTAHLGMPHLSMDVSVVWISSIFERYLQSLFSKSNLKIINLSVKPQLLFCFCNNVVKNKVVHTFYSLILFYRIELNLLELEPNRIESVPAHVALPCNSVNVYFLEMERVQILFSRVTV